MIFRVFCSCFFTGVSYVNDITNFIQIWIRKHCQICFILDFTPCIKITPGKLPNNQLSGIFCAGIPDCFCHDSGSADRTDLSQSEGLPPAVHKGRTFQFRFLCCLNQCCGAVTRLGGYDAGSDSDQIGRLWCQLRRRENKGGSGSQH